MGVYFGETEITNIDNLVPQAGQEITEIFFGSTEVFTVWAEFDGALPAQYSANGSVLADYRIYGAAGGVGDDSGTAYGYVVPMSVSDGTTSTATQIYIGDKPLGEDEYVDYAEEKVYRKNPLNIFDANKIVEDSANPSVFITDNMLRFGTGASLATINIDAPSVGAYTIDIEVKNGSASTNVVQFNAFFSDNTVNTVIKITLRDSDWHRVVGITDSTKKITMLQSVNTSGLPAFIKIPGAMLYAGHSPIPYLQPTDPPVPLPALPTVDGTTITDYAGQSAAPSRFYAKYRKG